MAIHDPRSSQWDATQIHLELVQVGSVGGDSLTVQKLNQLLSIIRLSLHRILILFSQTTWRRRRRPRGGDHQLHLFVHPGCIISLHFSFVCGNFHLISSSLRTAHRLLPLQPHSVGRELDLIVGCRPGTMTLGLSEHAVTSDAHVPPASVVLVLARNHGPERDEGKIIYIMTFNWKVCFQLDVEPHDRQQSVVVFRIELKWSLWTTFWLYSGKFTSAGLQVGVHDRSWDSSEGLPRIPSKVLSGILPGVSGDSFRSSYYKSTRKYSREFSRHSFR